MFVRTWRIIRRSLNRATVVLPIIVIMWATAGTLFTLFEGKTLLQGLWWATVTGATVGYGDLYPVTDPGKTVASAYMWLSSLAMIVLTAIVTASVIEDRNLFTNDEQERNEAALLLILIKLGVLPEGTSRLPSVSEMEQTHGFKATPDDE